MTYWCFDDGRFVGVGKSSWDAVQRVGVGMSIGLGSARVITVRHESDVLWSIRKRVHRRLLAYIARWPSRASYEDAWAFAKTIIMAMDGASGPSDAIDRADRATWPAPCPMPVIRTITMREIFRELGS